MKYYYSYPTPVGTLYITQNGGFISRITFSPESKNATYEETPLLKKVSAQFEEYFKGKRKIFDFPLKPEGTPFQQKIWELLKEIPYGKCCTYKQLAEASGNAKACRAVGMANKKNPLMIVVPCHRVIGTNGTLTGYASGLDVKKQLLKIEKEYSDEGLFSL